MWPGRGVFLAIFISLIWKSMFFAMISVIIDASILWEEGSDVPGKSLSKKASPAYL